MKQLPLAAGSPYRYLTALELEEFVERIAGSPEHWRHLVKPAIEQRVYEQIWDDAYVNAWIICWGEDQDTGFHDHGESAAAIAVISGEVREDRLLRSLPGTQISRTFGTGERFRIAPGAIHRVVHRGSGPAVTIHAYSPPLAAMGAYRMGPGGKLERHLVGRDAELRAQATAA